MSISEKLNKTFTGPDEFAQVLESAVQAEIESQIQPLINEIQSLRSEIQSIGDLAASVQTQLASSSE